jgi:hypothetical protein
LCTNLSLTRSADQPLAFNAWLHSLGLLAQALRFVGQTFFEGLDLFYAASVLHLRGFLVVGRERTTLSVTDRCLLIGAVIRRIWPPCVKLLTD